MPECLPDGDSLLAALGTDPVISDDEGPANVAARLPRPLIRQSVTTPPWPSVLQHAWSGPAAELQRYLADDILTARDVGEALVPRQLALLWERRTDLQTRFPLKDATGLHDYIGWALTAGVTEAAVAPEALSPAFMAQFAAPAPLSNGGDDIPVTWGMLLTRGLQQGRSLLGAARGFPAERAGRIAHGFWFAFIAPKLFDWPVEMVALVRAYFDTASPTEVDGLFLTRAALAPRDIHPVLQREFTLRTPASRWAYCRWLVLEALPRLGLSVDELDPRLRPFLAQRSPRTPTIARILEMVNGHQPRRGRRFDPADPAQCHAFEAWARANLCARFPQLALRHARPRRVARRHLALTGYWVSPTGRGEDLRGYTAALRATGYTAFAIVDIATGTLLDHHGRELAVEGLPAEALDAEINICVLNADTAFSDWARLRQLNVRARRVIGSWAWELDRLPSFWRYAFSFYDEIWAATSFADRAFRAAQARPVRLVPMAVTANEVTRLSRARLDIPPKHTMFLFLFDFRSYSARKNPEAVVEAFRSAFPLGRERVVLVLKTQAGSTAPYAWEQLQQWCAGEPRVRLIDTTLTRGETLGLIAASDAFISLHRSEGFGRGPAEAMLLGVPVIATDYSGTQDFLTLDTALLVDHRPVPVQPEHYPGVEGQCWADANVETAARHMRWVHANPAAARTLGLRGRTHINNAYAPRAVGAAMLEALGVRQPVPTATPIAAE